MNSNTLFVINVTGKLRILYTPIRVLCINETNRIPVNTWVYVEEILSGKDDVLLYVIFGKIYIYNNFRIPQMA